MLPVSVLKTVQEELRDYKGLGMSIMEMSHRSSAYESIHAQAEASIKKLLGLEDDYRVLFLQGGASGQFAMVPMNFLPMGQWADYLVNGTWGEKALEEARTLGQARVAASTKATNYTRVPRPEEIERNDPSAYVHLTSNETIQGVQWPAFPDLGDRPLIGDMSSDFLSRPFDARRFDLIYAGAQKNLGPAGVTAVLIRESFLARAQSKIPVIFRYATHARNNSLYNTPPTMAVYVLNLVLQWIEHQGGLNALASINGEKAKLIYEVIDQNPGFYRGHAEASSRSWMNITFRLPDEASEKKFVREAEAAGMVGLAGHRSVGGIRASLYNAVPLAACQTLASFMRDFASRAG